VARSSWHFWAAPDSELASETRWPAFTTCWLASGTKWPESVPGWLVSVPGWAASVPAWAVSVPGWTATVQVWSMSVPDCWPASIPGWPASDVTINRKSRLPPCSGKKEIIKESSCLPMFRIRVRIQAGQNCPQNGKNEDILCLKSSLLGWRLYDPNKFFCNKITLVWIRIGSGFSNSLDLVSDSAKCLDLNPYSVNPDSKRKTSVYTYSTINTVRNGS
jgi:hypothetical protein